MEIIHRLRNYLEFYLGAKTIFDIHSPLAAKLAKAYISPTLKLPDILSEKRKELLENSNLLQPEDYGAGSKIHTDKLTVASVARRSLSTAQQLRGLYEIAATARPAVAIELGTSFGLSTLTIQLAVPETDLYSIEGNFSIHSMAQDLVNKTSLSKHPDLVYGTFQTQLPRLVEKLDTIDFVFIDGDHTLNGTLNNLTTLLPVLHQRSIVLIHDIYWSEEMKLAWQKCKQMDMVKMSLDFYDLGILIFDPSIHQKQHFSIVPYWYKPWRIGLFA